MALFGSQPIITQTLHFEIPHLSVLEQFGGNVSYYSRLFATSGSGVLAQIAESGEDKSSRDDVTEFTDDSVEPVLF